MSWSLHDDVIYKSKQMHLKNCGGHFDYQMSQLYSNVKYQLFVLIFKLFSQKMLFQKEPRASIECID